MSDPISMATRRVQPAPRAGDVLIVAADGSFAYIRGKAGQVLTVGQDGVPAWSDGFALPKLPFQADVDPPPDTSVPSTALPASALLTAIIDRVNNLATDQAKLRAALTNEIKRGNALAASLRSKGYQATS